MTTKIGVAIVGASGYAARELIRILLNHPHVEITAATSRQDEAPRLESLHPSLARRIDLTCEVFDAGRVAQQASYAFLALPHTASMAVVPALRQRGRAGHRLERRLSIDRPAGLRRLVRPCTHGPRRSAHGGLWAARAVSGPDSTGRTDRQPRLLHLGKYSGIGPSDRRGPDRAQGIIIDAKSGVSGAGRSPKLTYHFPECNESLSAYSVGQHRHTPEIDQVLTGLTEGRDDPVEVIFTPHLVPMDRGIFATIYGTPKRPAVEHDLRRFIAPSTPAVRSSASSITCRRPRTRPIPTFATSRCGSCEAGSWCWPAWTT